MIEKLDAPNPNKHPTMLDCVNLNLNSFVPLAMVHARAYAPAGFEGEVLSSDAPFSETDKYAGFPVILNTNVRLPAVHPTTSYVNS